MKGTLSTIVITIMIAVLMTSCGNSEAEQPANEKEPVNVEQPANEEQPTNVELPANEEEGTNEAPNVGDGVVYDEDYTIRINNKDIPLHGWDNEIDLIEVLGAPSSEKITELENADTFTGSFTKDMTFPGLKLLLFSPKQNGETFWIMDMLVTSDSYSTATGLRVGMNVSELQSINPEIAIVLDGRTDPNNCAYEIHDPSKYDFAKFEVKDGIIQEIRIYNEMP